MTNPKEPEDFRLTAQQLAMAPNASTATLPSAFPQYAYYPQMPFGPAPSNGTGVVPSTQHLPQMMPMPVAYGYPPAYGMMPYGYMPHPVMSPMGSVQQTEAAKK